MGAAPYEINGLEFYERYDEGRPQSHIMAHTSRVDLGRSGRQFFYSAIHARILPTRLPPLHAQLEDADVYALLQLAHEKRAFPISFLSENWSGVFGSLGYPLPARRQMGRPAIVWSQSTVSWRYVCVGGAYTLCGSGHLRQVVDAVDLKRTTPKGKRGQYPWQRPCTEGDYGSYKYNLELRNLPVFGLDMDMEVAFDHIDWPEFHDADRSSDALNEWLQESASIPQGISRVYWLSTMHAKSIDRPEVEQFAFGENEGDTMSEYDPELTGLPAMGYCVPDEHCKVDLAWKPKLKPMTDVDVVRRERDSVTQNPNKRGLNQLLSADTPSKRPRMANKSNSLSTLQSSHPSTRYGRGGSARAGVESGMDNDNQNTPSDALNHNLTDTASVGKTVLYEDGAKVSDFDIICKILSKPIYTSDGTMMHTPEILIQKALQLEELVDQRLIARAKQFRTAAIMQYKAGESREHPRIMATEHSGHKEVGYVDAGTRDEETDDVRKLGGEPRQQNTPADSARHVSHSSHQSPGVRYLSQVEIGSTTGVRCTSSSKHQELTAESGDETRAQVKEEPEAFYVEYED